MTDDIGVNALGQVEANRKSARIRLRIVVGHQWNTG
jgi:hypothetical protein